MANEKLFCRVIDNYTGAGWYWEVMRQDQVMASGRAATHAAAVVQASHAKQEFERQSVRQHLNRFGWRHRYNKDVEVV
jgi:hypothetical protein